jgi:hypothetical protein
MASDPTSSDDVCLVPWAKPTNTSNKVQDHYHSTVFDTTSSNPLPLCFYGFIIAGQNNSTNVFTALMKL